MYNITPETLIANYFAEVWNSREVPLSTLSEIRKRILLKFSDERKRGMFIFIDWDKDSIRNVFSQYRHYFSEEGQIVKFVPKNKDNFFIDFCTIFNSKFDNSEIKWKFCDKFKEVLVELGLIEKE